MPLTHRLRKEHPNYPLDRQTENCPQKRGNSIWDINCPKRRRPGTATTKQTTPLGMRWTIERTNSWLTNYGQLRRNTDRYPHHRLAQLCLAIALIITPSTGEPAGAPPTNPDPSMF